MLKVREHAMRTMRTTKRNLRFLACWMAVILASATAVCAVEEQPKSQPPKTQMTDDELEEIRTKCETRAQAEKTGEVSVEKTGEKARRAADRAVGS